MLTNHVQAAQLDKHKEISCDLRQTPAEHEPVMVNDNVLMLNTQY